MAPSCGRWMSSGTGWRGEFWTLSSSEWPSDAAVSFLSDALERGGASAVLFEPEGVFGDTPTSKAKRQALAADAGRGAEGAGGCLTPWDVQSKRVFAEGAVGPTLQAGTHEAQNIQPSVLAFAQNTRDEVRIQGDGTISGALAAQPGMKQQTYVAAPISMADDTQNAAVDVDMSGTLKVGGAPPLVALTLGAARECPPGHRRRSAPRCPSTSRASRAGG